MGDILIAGESGDTAVLVAPDAPFVVETGDNDAEVLLPPEPNKAEGAERR